MAFRPSRLASVALAGACALALAAPAAGATPPERVSVASAAGGATQGDATSEEASVTPDGRYVAFASFADNLVVGDTNGWKDVFVRDRVAGTTERVSLPDAPTRPGETQGNGHSEWSGISDDGCRVVFVSAASNLVAGDDDAARDVFVRDRCQGRTKRASLPAATAGPWCPTGDSTPAYVSGDGRHVSFASFSTRLVPGCTTWLVSHVYVHDLQTGATEIVDATTSGGVADSWSWGGNLSADGRFVTFSSLAANLVPADGNGQADVFVRDRLTGALERVNVPSGGGEADRESVASFSGKSRVVTPEGRYVVFRSAASNLVPGDANTEWDVFVRDRVLDVTERLSTTDTGADANGQSQVGQISADGRWASFQSQATNLDPRDVDSDWDVYVKDRRRGDVDLVSVNAAGESTNGWIDDPSMSPDGRYLVWADYGDNLVPGDTNAAGDVVLVDRATPAVPPGGGGTQTPAPVSGPPGQGTPSPVVGTQAAAAAVTARPVRCAKKRRARKRRSCRSARRRARVSRRGRRTARSRRSRRR